MDKELPNIPPSDDVREHERKIEAARAAAMAASEGAMFEDMTGTGLTAPAPDELESRPKAFRNWLSVFGNILRRP